jgi:RNA polymerase sigma-70 factor, ECF subfamily
MEPTTASGPPRPRRRVARVLLATQPDTCLAALAGEGSDAAFEEIVRRHRPVLVAFAGRVASPSTADDVVQESMLRAHAALQRGDRPKTPRAWLFQIVRRMALNERRTWKMHTELDETIDGVEQPPAALERRNSVQRLLSGLDDLPSQQRRAIVQRELEGRGHNEIAASLGVSAGAVRQLIFRARANLRSGFGALIPLPLLRLAAFSGGAEQFTAGAAGAGLGFGAGKLALGAVLSAGVIVAGSGAVSPRAATSPAAAGSSSAIASTATPRQVQAQASARAGVKRRASTHPTSTKSGVRSFTARRQTSGSDAHRDDHDASMPGARPGGGQQQAAAQGGGAARGGSRPGSGDWSSGGSGSGGSGNGTHDSGSAPEPGAHDSAQPA